MKINLSPEEDQLVEYAKEAVARYNTIRHATGGIDTLYSFILSDSGMIHDGACYETYLGHASVCGERHAIANMVLRESYAAKIKSIVVADPVPAAQENGTTPCQHAAISSGPTELQRRRSFRSSTSSSGTAGHSQSWRNTR